MEVIAVGCIKCGKKLGASAVFCDECLEEMEKRPVKPGTLVKLPSRPATPPAKKKTLRRVYLWDAEDRIDSLRVKLRWTSFALIVTFLCLVATLAALLWLMNAQEWIAVPFSSLF